MGNLFTQHVDQMLFASDAKAQTSILRDSSFDGPSNAAAMELRKANEKYDGPLQT
jgi:hypothetical protein